MAHYNEQQSQYRAYDDAGGNRKIKPEIFFLDTNIPWQFKQPGDFNIKYKNYTQQHTRYPNYNQNPTQKSLHGIISETLAISDRLQILSPSDRMFSLLPAKTNTREAVP